MSGQDLNVTSGKIGELSGKIDNYQRNVGDRIGDLNRVVNLIESGWKGSAKGQYDEVQNRLNQRLKSLQQDLENLQNLVKMSADGFDEEERRRLASFSNMETSNGKSSAILDM
ncbi:WXG100 family type VII secretion target [Streptomyces sp. NPDC051907]|uniref:WXG100 family type VII secretion target n=1 Tax=Streptomyces sp. NPDC051907 TaxID=3155284 RepID=UPI00343A636F